MNNLRILALFVLTIGFLTAACGGKHAHTINTNLRQFEFYEYSHIKDIDRSVVVTLGGLGYPDLILLGGDASSAPSVEFRLPDDATQGPDIWYIIHLHFLIEFDDDTGDGYCSVTAGANQWAWASVDFDTLIVDDSPFIRVLGQSSTSTRMEVRYYNYPPIMAIKPGKNVMTFKLEESGRAKVKSLQICNDTGIESTTVPPSPFSGSPGTPSQLTESQEKTATDTALANPDVQKLLEGKQYTITRIGPSMGGGVGRLGANMDITFDKAYSFKGDFPYFPGETNYLDAQLTGLEVFVNLEEGKVVQIWPEILPPGSNGGEG